MHDVRLKLATQGLPKGSVTGFELMETSRFGITQFQERLNFQRGLEGELTRSIQALASVQNARVHLALPNQNGFFREQQKPSASVLVTLHPGRFLDRAQIAGIVHLVASSVPELQPAATNTKNTTPISCPNATLPKANGKVTNIRPGPSLGFNPEAKTIGNNASPAIMIYGAYMPKNASISGTVVGVALIDTFVSLLAGLAITYADNSIKAVCQNVRRHGSAITLPK